MFFTSTVVIYINSVTYVTGSSYSGVYVPLLAEAIVNGNNNGATPLINLEVGPSHPPSLEGWQVHTADGIWLSPVALIKLAAKSYLIAVHACGTSNTCGQLYMKRLPAVYPHVKQFACMQRPESKQSVAVSGL